MFRQAQITNFFTNKNLCFVCGNTERECKTTLGDNTCSLKCELRLKKDQEDQEELNVEEVTWDNFYENDNIDDYMNHLNQETYQDELSEEAINERLEWYNKSISTEESTEQPNIDILDYIKYVQGVCDKVKEKKLDLFVCATQIECNCLNDCICDDDNYYRVEELKIDTASNNIMYITFKTAIKTNKKSTLKFFTLDKDATENTIFLLKRVLKKRALYKETLVCPEHHKLNFDILEGTHSQEMFLEVKFNFMNYYFE